MEEGPNHVVTGEQLRLALGGDSPAFSSLPGDAANFCSRFSQDALRSSLRYWFLAQIVLEQRCRAIHSNAEANDALKQLYDLGNSFGADLRVQGSTSSSFLPHRDIKFIFKKIEATLRAKQASCAEEKHLQMLRAQRRLMEHQCPSLLVTVTRNPNKQPQVSNNSGDDGGQGRSSRGQSKKKQQEITVAASVDDDAGGGVTEGNDGSTQDGVDRTATEALRVSNVLRGATVTVAAGEGGEPNTGDQSLPQVLPSLAPLQPVALSEEAAAALEAQKSAYKELLDNIRLAQLASDSSAPMQALHRLKSLFGQLSRSVDLDRWDSLASAQEAATSSASRDIGRGHEERCASNPGGLATILAAGYKAYLAFCSSSAAAAQRWGGTTTWWRPSSLDEFVACFLESQAVLAAGGIGEDTTMPPRKTSKREGKKRHKQQQHQSETAPIAEEETPAEVLLASSSVEATPLASSTPSSSVPERHGASGRRPVLALVEQAKYRCQGRSGELDLVLVEFATSTVLLVVEAKFNPPDAVKAWSQRQRLVEGLRSATNEVLASTAEAPAAQHPISCSARVIQYATAQGDQSAASTGAVVGSRELLSMVRRISLEGTPQNAPPLAASSSPAPQVKLTLESFAFFLEDNSVQKNNNQEGGDGNVTSFSIAVPASPMVEQTPCFSGVRHRYVFEVAKLLATHLSSAACPATNHSPDEDDAQSMKSILDTVLFPHVQRFNFAALPPRAYAEMTKTLRREWTLTAERDGLSSPEELSGFPRMLLWIP